MIPQGINRDHVLEDLARIDRQGGPPSRESRSVLVRHADKVPAEACHLGSV
jgi:hypothetical protein